MKLSARVLAALLAGKKVVVEGGAHAADVKGARRGGGKSNSYHYLLGDCHYLFHKAAQFVGY